VTQEEFDFWQQAYLAAMEGCLAAGGYYANPAAYAEMLAGLALAHYRTAKATVVQTTYATRD